MNLFDLFVKVKLDDQASQGVSRLAGKLGGGLEAAAKVGVAAVGAASAGIVALTTSAIQSYAEYEQLVGGVETLFKDSAATVQEYASNAYMTAGISANRYMETITSFSASLISALGGDTAAAAEYGNQALIDMSDNANKMGTDMDVIIQTYQSLSRGNFAMLDNLKLGYGGTKAEMERLIADANAVKVANGEMADLSIDSFADMTEAIHIIQTEMGITGTTAAEASETISGSIGAMRAAWQNLVVGIADDNADFETLIDNMISTVETASNNILPRIEVALNGVARLIDAILPEFAARIPAVIADTLPVIVEAAVSIVQSLVEGISDNAEMLTQSAMDSVGVIISGLIEMLPLLLTTGADIIMTVVQGLANELPNAIPKVTSSLLALVDSMSSPSMISSFIGAGVTILTSLVNGISSMLPQLIGASVDAIDSFIATIAEMLPLLVESGVDIIVSLVNGLAEHAPTLIPTIVDSILVLVTAMTSPDVLIPLLDAGLTLIVSLVTGIIAALPKLVESAPTIVSNLVDAIIDAVPEIVDAGFDLIEGLWDGISGAGEWLKGKVEGFFDGFIGDVKSLLGIASPSTLFRDDIGKMLALGIGVGFENEIGNVGDMIQRGIDDMIPSIDIGNVDSGIFGDNGFAGGVSVVQNIYSTAKTAADLMQEALYQQERAVMLGV